jgi:hypothetical protein
LEYTNISGGVIKAYPEIKSKSHHFLSLLIFLKWNKVILKNTDTNNCFNNTTSIQPIPIEKYRSLKRYKLVSSFDLIAAKINRATAKN